MDEKLKQVIADVVNTQLCEWGTTATVQMGDCKYSLRVLLNEQAYQLVDKLIDEIETYLLVRQNDDGEICVFV